MHVRNLHWIVIEDANATNPNVERILQRSGIPYAYMQVFIDDDEDDQKAAGLQPLSLECRVSLNVFWVLDYRLLTCRSWLDSSKCES